MSEQFHSPPPPNYEGEPPSSTNVALDGPQMSTPATLANIFFEPTRTFDALRAHPRFLVATLLTVVLITIYSVSFFERVGFENFMRAQIVASQPDMDADLREQAIERQSSPIVKGISYASPLLILLITLTAGGGLYLAGTAAMGGRINYKQALSVWAYSSFAYTLLFAISNLIVLFIKSPEDIDPLRDQRGLVHANPSILVDAVAHPVIATVVSAFDLFALFGLFLAAVGLRRVGKMSSGAAWSVVLGLYLLGIVFRVALAVAFNRAS